MHLDYHRQFLAVIIGLFLAANFVCAADTTNGLTSAPRSEAVQNYLQLQEQLHLTQMAIQENQMANNSAIQSNANLMEARLDSLEQSVATQRVATANAARKTQQTILLLAGVLGLVGLGIVLLMLFFQWRAFALLAQISAQSQAVIANSHTAVHQMAAPGRATVEDANVRLLDAVAQLEKRIQDLESDQRVLPATSSSKPAELLAKVQQLLDASQPEQALECLETFLLKDPGNAGALVKKAIALEKLGRLDEALTFCDQALAVDNSLALAHLHKGGLLNRLRRYDEALDCYESALQAQEKKSFSITK